MFRIVFVSVLVLVSQLIQAQPCHEFGGGIHANPPMGVMQGHTHAKGVWMISLRSMQMTMSGVEAGSLNGGVEGELSKYAMLPDRMIMGMQMVGVMYGVSDRLTAGVMMGYLGLQMTMIEGQGQMNHEHSGHHAMHASEPSKMKTSGMGDLKLSGLYRLLMSPERCLHLIVGAQLPTGKTGLGGMGHDVYPYLMQLGAGSMQAKVGLNYSRLYPHWLWGSQISWRSPIYMNARGYKVGDLAQANFWVNRSITEWLAGSLRVQGVYEGAVSGKDKDVIYGQSPLVLEGDVQRISMKGSIGLATMFGEHWKLAAEAGLPFVQQSTGYHMIEQWSGIVGAQFVF